MKYCQTGASALYLALLLGGVFLPLAAPAANAPMRQPVAGDAAATTPALMLARDWQVGQSPSGYWVSEKFDGVRAFWDGKQLRFRSGQPIAAPGWFTAALPETALDGELWLARGRFDELSGMVRRSNPVDADWQQLHYLIFDLPGSAGSFTERSERIKTVVEQANQPWLQAVAQQRVSDASALQKLLKKTVQEGGEGLVLHRANALWSPGRSDALRKLKLLPDEEARVVGHVSGKGRNAGKLGALLLELPSGQRFALGSGFSDAQRADPPAVGSVVTYRYRSRTPQGLPRFASYLRVRGAE